MERVRRRRVATKPMKERIINLKHTNWNKGSDIASDRQEDPLEEYQREAAASITEWRSPHEEGAPHVNI